MRESNGGCVRTVLEPLTIIGHERSQRAARSPRDLRLLPMVADRLLTEHDIECAVLEGQVDCTTLTPVNGQAGGQRQPPRSCWLKISAVDEEVHPGSRELSLLHLAP
jgi:hypothetical protein